MSKKKPMSKTDKMKLKKDIFLFSFFVFSGLGMVAACIAIHNASRGENGTGQALVIVLWMAILFFVFWMANEKTDHKIKKFKSESPISDLRPNDFGYQEPKK